MHAGICRAASILLPGRVPLRPLAVVDSLTIKGGQAVVVINPSISQYIRQCLDSMPQLAGVLSGKVSAG